MIYGIDWANQMFSLLHKLELINHGHTLTDAIPNFATRYGAGVIWDSNSNDMDEYDSPTDEELDILIACGDQYYVDDILLGDIDEQ